MYTMYKILTLLQKMSDDMNSKLIKDILCSDIVTLLANNEQWHFWIIKLLIGMSKYGHFMGMGYSKNIYLKF